MTTYRARWNHLTTLIDRQQHGRYKLPADVLAAYAVPTAVQALTVPQPDEFRHDQAASQLVAAVTAGRDPDLPGLAERLSRVAVSQETAEHARRVHREAFEQARAAALATATDVADTIVTTVLRPAYNALLERVREDVARLDGTVLATTTLLAAPAKVRAAYGNLVTAGEQYAVLRAARYSCTFLTGAQPEYDTDHRHLEFRTPHKLFPARGAHAPLPKIEAPADPVERLRWLVTTAAAGDPWLPTVAEQDAAWYTVNGQQFEARRQNYRNAQAFGAALGIGA